MANLIPRNSSDNLRAMFDRMIGNNPSGYMTYDQARKHAATTADVIRTGGESVVVGAVLGVINASRADGMDIRVTPTAKVGAPIDGIAAGVLGVIAIVSAQEPYAKDFVNASGAAAAICAFRKVSDLVTEINIKKSGATPGGGAVIPGKISKATFGSDGSYGPKFSADGYAAGSARVQGSMIGGPSSGAHLDPIVVAGMRL